MFRTEVTEILGIEYPITQGGMWWVSRAELVSSVSNAGGLGILSALTFSSPGELAAEIRKTRDLTDRPFGVNVTLVPTLRTMDINSYLDVIIEGGVKVVETAARNPEPYMKRLKEAGVKVIHKCTAVRFARTAQRVGCDIVSIDGFECAGHPGEEDVTSLILIPLTVDALDIPVIASGGFGDGRGLVAALALGASGINMGTRFLVAKESPVHHGVKEWLINSSERDTMLVMRSLRNTERVLRNAAAEKVAQMEKEGASLDQLAPILAEQQGESLLGSGELDRGLLACGQVVGLTRDIPSVEEIIDSIISEAEEIMEHRFNTCSMFQPLRKPC